MQAIGEFDGAVRGSHFGCMNRAGQLDNVLARPEHRFRLRRGGDPRVGETALNFAITIEIPQRFRRRDRRDDKRPALRRSTVLHYTDLVAGSGGDCEPGNDFVPVQKLSVGSDGVAEVSRRRGDGGRMPATRSKRESPRPAAGHVVAYNEIIGPISAHATEVANREALRLRQNGSVCGSADSINQ